jgi:hypothetical protein
MFVLKTHERNVICLCMISKLYAKTYQCKYTDTVRTNTIYHIMSERIIIILYYPKG